MRTMRESYNQLGAAAEAYNVGKAKLAQNITAKGVEASANETLPELAEKVNAISQESYTIDGGEMYAKQLSGSLDTPKYWNLYEVLTNLLSDGRLVSYGGILLAEYNRDYDSLALAGAGAGGAYVVSDKNADGQFIMYTADTTHTWATEFDGYGNRWVAYCFADEYHDFQITDTNTSPRSIFIGRKVGTITSLVNGRVSQVVVPDGNELVSFNSAGYTQNFGKQLVLRNLQSIGNNALHSGKNIESVYIEADTWNGFLFHVDVSDITSAILKIKGNASSGYGHGLLGDHHLGMGITKLAFLSVSAQEIRGSLFGTGGPSSENNIELHIQTELLSLSYDGLGGMTDSVKRIKISYFTNDRNRGLVFNLYSYTQNNCTDIEVQDGWCKPLDISQFPALTEENIVNHILNKLGDNTGQSPLTITLGATNLAKLTVEEIAIATNKGFTLA